MLACTAMLVGCSDDDVLNNNELENQQGEKMRAYMTFSIASSTNSSRGTTNSGTTSGDEDGNQEHSGHENAGTANENKINEVLIAFYNTSGDDGFCDVFTMQSPKEDGTIESSESEYNSYSTKLTKNSDNTYSLAEPFALNSLGKYLALIIVNPATEIKNLVNTTQDNSTSVAAFYKSVIEGKATSVKAIIGEGENNFMMANRKKIEINVTKDNNDPAKAATYMESNAAAPIEVERVVSKITFRHKPASADFQKKGKITDGKNLYDITETKYDYNIVKGDFWFKNTNGIYDYLTNLYKAENTEGKVYWVFVDSEGNTKRYKIDENFKGTEDDKRGETEGSTGDGLYEGELSSETVKAQVVVEVTSEEASETIVYVGSKVPTGETATYHVQLKRFAIVNKNNQVFYVRHTSTTPASATVENAWGIVSASNYLIDPHTAAKSATTSWTAPLSWPTGWSAASTYFNNDFKTVVDNIEAGTLTAFKDFEATATETDDVTSSVTPSETEASATTPENQTVGTHMEYVLENSVIDLNQNALTSTGVIFEAQIYDNTGEIVEYMLGYNGHYYPSFLALQEATIGEEADITGSPYWKYTDEDYKAMTPEEKQNLAKELVNEGVTLYQDGKCYYFSAEIKHFDDNKDAKGVMEYAIMRNNIYSLAVTGLNGFGFSSIDLESGVLNDSDTETEKVYLTMQAKILPWIVRFNDIEF